MTGLVSLYFFFQQRMSVSSPVPLWHYLAPTFSPIQTTLFIFHKSAWVFNVETFFYFPSALYCEQLPEDQLSEVWLVFSSSISLLSRFSLQGNFLNKAAKTIAARQVTLRSEVKSVLLRWSPINSRQAFFMKMFYFLSL